MFFPAFKKQIPLTPYAFPQKSSAHLRLDPSKHDTNFQFFLGPLGVLCLVLTKKSLQHRWPPGRAVQSTDKITNTDVHLSRSVVEIAVSNRNSTCLPLDMSYSKDSHRRCNLFPPCHECLLHDQRSASLNMSSIVRRYLASILAITVHFTTANVSKNGPSIFG